MVVAATAENMTLFVFLEKSRRVVKSHRCVGETEFKFTSCDESSDHACPEDDTLCSTYLVTSRLPDNICQQVNRYLERCSSH